VWVVAEDGFRVEHLSEFDAGSAGTGDLVALDGREPF
jgi:hypothetical protein